MVKIRRFLGNALAIHGLHNESKPVTQPQSPSNDRPITDKICKINALHRAGRRQAIVIDLRCGVEPKAKILQSFPRKIGGAKPALCQNLKKWKSESSGKYDAGSSKSAEAK